MAHITLTRSVMVAGEHAEAGSVFTIGTDISAADADYFVRHAGAVASEDETATDEPAADLADMTVTELKKLVEAEGIDMGSARAKADIIAAIEAARAPAD